MFARTRAFLSSIILFLLGLILIFALVYWIRIFLNQQNSDIPIYKVDTNKNEIALTFDISYNERNIDEILEVLDKYDVKNSHKQDEEKLAKEGNSIIYVVINNEISAIIGVNDIVRENSKEVISKLNKNKIETVMLTGDNTQTAEKIAKEIGITTVISNVTPREKTEVVKKLKTEGKYVMMCGDGINDSPALASSNIGVSVNSGTDIAMDSSDVILTRNDLNSILNLINISKKTIRNIKQNLFWAFFYNSLMIPIAMGLLGKWGVTINPMIASLAMVISSLTVTLNALRLKKIKI